MKSMLLLVFILAFAPIVLAQEATEAAQQQAELSTALQDLSLKEAIQLGLKNNLAIEIERFNPEIDETQVFVEESRFEPLFGADFNVNDASQPTASRLTGFDAINNRIVDYNFTFRQLLKTGTAYDVSFQNSRVETNQLFTTINPRFDSSLFLNLSQPLMRNFGMEITKAPIRIAQTNMQAADHRLRQRMMDIALQVEQAYWDLVFARRELAVRRQSLAYAQDLYENNKKQVEVGTMAPLEIVVAEAEVAAREEGIITTEALIRNTEDRLKTFILPQQLTGYEKELVPSDEPQVSPLQISEDDAVKNALENNPDIRALQTDLESRRLNTKLAANALKPQLDFRAAVGYNGLGGERLLFDDTDPFNPIVIGVTPGGYGDALSSLFDSRTWSVGFVFGLPLGNQEAEANYVRADLTQKQTARVLDNARQQLALNVRTTIRNLQSDYKRLEAARASRVLQEKKLDAERKKLNVGLSTNHIVLDFQDDLAQSQSLELQAMVDYEKHLAQLERYMGTMP